VDVFFRAVLQSAVEGETGSVTVAADDERWSASEDVRLEKGENFAEVKVIPPPGNLTAPLCAILQVHTAIGDGAAPSLRLVPFDGLPCS